VVAIGLLLGARFDGGVTGVLVTLLAAVLLALVFAAISDAMALLLRQQEALIGLSQFMTLPLTFLSSVMMAPTLMPTWVSEVARYNPVDWAAAASRSALSATPDWGFIGIRLGLLALLVGVVWAAATRAFRANQAAV
jgi:ABC-2 type transport system permease protein